MIIWCSLFVIVEVKSCSTSELQVKHLDLLQGQIILFFCFEIGEDEKEEQTVDEQKETEGLDWEDWTTDGRQES